MMRSAVHEVNIMQEKQICKKKESITLAPKVQNAITLDHFLES